MKLVNINSNDLSIIFWKKILDNSFSKKKIIEKEFFEKIDSLESLRSQSSYNTGSVSSTTAWLLFSLTLFFKPKVIFEIGSFIGKSTFSMSLAADLYLNEHKCEVYCCDESNEIKFPNLSKTKINQFHKKTSFEMLKEINEFEKVDFVHLDGRLNSDDYDLLKSYLTDDTIFILDDFEGGEKGVINFINLLNNKLISRNTHCLIYPIKDDTKYNFDLKENSTSAVILPLKNLRISAQ